MMRRRRNSSDDVQIVNDDPAVSFVDLTQESPSSTSILGQRTRSSHFFLVCQRDCRPRVRRQLAGRTRTSNDKTEKQAPSAARLHSPYSSSSDITINSDDDDDAENEMDIQILSPVNVNTSMPWPELPDDVSATPDTSSPGRKQVKCPVCMDNETQIRANGLRLTSTICGHIFCNRCIRGAIQTQHRCPACRKKLTMRQIHPIFL